MAQLKELTSEEIVTLFKDPQTLFFFMKDKKKMHNGKYDAIGIKKQKNATAFLKKYFQKQPGEAENYMAAPITFRDVEYLQEFMVKCKIQRLCIVDVGLFTQKAVQEAQQIVNITRLLQYKLDNENFYWIGFPDGTTYTNNESLCLYINIHEARQQADSIGGHLGTLNIMKPVFNECFAPDKNYYINNVYVTGSVLTIACKKHFEATMLPFNTVKEYIDKGLSVFAGQDAWDEFEIFAHQGMSTFFSARADIHLIHPLVQQSFPQDSDFYSVPKRENLYSFINTEYIFIDCMYHCPRALFEEAIMGRNDYRQWTDQEKADITQCLFEAPYLYIILSREKYKEQFHCSVPSVIDTTKKRVWIFDDYGKSLSFCQRKDRFVAEGVPAIGLIASARKGWDLHTILSLLLTIGVEDIELNPLEDDRALLSIMNMLHSQKLPILSKREMVRIQLDKSEDTREETPWFFNDIMLA